MAGPRKTTAISIRFDESQKVRLRNAAAGLRMKPSDVIRLAVEQLLDEIDRSGKVVVPVRLQEEAVLEEKKGYISSGEGKKNPGGRRTGKNKD